MIMKNKTTLLLLIFYILAYSSFAQQSDSKLSEDNVSESIAINLTSKTALLDGRCGNDEWEVATKIELPAGSLHLSHV